MSQYRVFGDVKSDAYQATPMSTEPTPPQPEPPTDTERAHTFEWLCTKCGKRGMPGTHVTYEETHDGCGGACQSVPIKTEPQQGAGEWVRQRWLRVEMPQYDYGHGLALHESDALELAQRCDEAEAQVKRYDGYHSALVTESCDLRAQLAAAQAEAARLREALGWYAGELRFCNSMSREGDESRDRLAKDRGNRALDALEIKEDQPPLE